MVMFFLFFIFYFLLDFLLKIKGQSLATKLVVALGYKLT